MNVGEQTQDVYNIWKLYETIIDLWDYFPKTKLPTATASLKKQQPSWSCICIDLKSIIRVS
jgi:hypothetical protein